MLLRLQGRSVTFSKQQTQVMDEHIPLLTWARPIVWREPPTPYVHSRASPVK